VCKRFAASQFSDFQAINIACGFGDNCNYPHVKMSRKDFEAKFPGYTPDNVKGSGRSASPAGGKGKGQPKGKNLANVPWLGCASFYNTGACPGQQDGSCSKIHMSPAQVKKSNEAGRA
jgi:hypothetical protein